MTIFPNRAEVVKMLVAHGLNVNARDENGETALEFKVEYSDMDSIAVLLANGANVNAQDYDGVSALMKAAWQNKIDVVKILLQHHADPRLRNKFGNTALSYLRTVPADYWEKSENRIHNRIKALLSAAEAKAR